MNLNGEETPNPALFVSEEGCAISFHLIVAEEEAKNELTKLVWNCGGRVEPEYCQMQPQTVLLVDQITYENRNDFNRIAFKHLYINDCISKNELLNLADYLYYKDIEDCPEYFLDVIYFRIRDFRHIENFPDVEDNFYTVISISPTALDGSSPGISNSMMDSNVSTTQSPLPSYTMSNAYKAFYRKFSLSSPRSLSTKSKLSRSTSSNVALKLLLKTLNQSTKRSKVNSFKFHKISCEQFKSQSQESDSLNMSDQDGIEDSLVKTKSKMILEKSGVSIDLQTENIEKQDNRPNGNSQQPPEVDANRILKTCKVNLKASEGTDVNDLQKDKQKLREPSNITDIEITSENNENVADIKQKGLVNTKISEQNKISKSKRRTRRSIQYMKLDKNFKNRCIVCNVKHHNKLSTITNNILETGQLENQLLTDNSIPAKKLPVSNALICRDKKKDNTSFLKQIGHACVIKKNNYNNLINNSIQSLESSVKHRYHLENISSGLTNVKKKQRSASSKLKSGPNKTEYNMIKTQCKENSKNKSLDALIQDALNKPVFVRLKRISFPCSCDDKVNQSSKSKECPMYSSSKQIIDLQKSCSIIKKHSKPKMVDTKTDKPLVKNPTKLKNIPKTQSERILESKCENASKLKGIVKLGKNSVKIPFKKESKVVRSDEVIKSKLTSREIKIILNNEDKFADLKTDFKNHLSATLENYMKFLKKNREKNVNHSNDYKAQQTKMLRSIRLLRRIVFNNIGTKGPMIRKLKVFLNSIIE